MQVLIPSWFEFYLGDMILEIQWSKVRVDFLYSFEMGTVQFIFFYNFYTVSSKLIIPVHLPYTEKDKLIHT